MKKENHNKHLYGGGYLLRITNLNTFSCAIKWIE